MGCLQLPPSSDVSCVRSLRYRQSSPDHPCWRAHQRLNGSLFLSFVHSKRWFRSQCGSVTTPANCGSELSNLLAPFHKICTPIHTSRNAESFKITFVPVAPTLLASRSA